MSIAASAAKLSEAGIICCPDSVKALGMSHKAHAGDSDLLDLWSFYPSSTVLTSGIRIANANCDLQFAAGALAMLGELTNIPTDTLIDMLYIILAGEVAITASEATEIEQIQGELQRRGGAQNWSCGTVN